MYLTHASIITHLPLRLCAPYVRRVSLVFPRPCVSIRPDTPEKPPAQSRGKVRASEVYRLFLAFTSSKSAQSPLAVMQTTCHARLRKGYAGRSQPVRRYTVTPVHFLGRIQLPIAHAIGARAYIGR